MRNYCLVLVLAALQIVTVAAGDAGGLYDLWVGQRSKRMVHEARQAAPSSVPVTSFRVATSAYTTCPARAGMYVSGKQITPGDICENIVPLDCVDKANSQYPSDSLYDDVLCDYDLNTGELLPNSGFETDPTVPCPAAALKSPQSGCISFSDNTYLTVPSGAATSIVTSPYTTCQNIPGYSANRKYIPRPIGSSDALECSAINPVYIDSFSNLAHSSANCPATNVYDATGCVSVTDF
ncbi:glycogen phosphorylase-like protein [Pseudohyphozyma bogoriensis]|nr:glycogen phosphorylase-like protein [Pseudohyphozyma bogoriensis]